MEVPTALAPLLSSSKPPEPTSIWSAQLLGPKTRMHPPEETVLDSMVPLTVAVPADSMHML